MRPLLTILRLYWRENRRAFLAGIALSAVTLIAGIALLGLSGWFITASALAGVAGVGIAFDFFRPSAAIRFLALVRTAARYGERLTTHEATLRFLADLRISLFTALSCQPYPIISRLRSTVALNRVMADVDALDAVYLRIFAPVVAATVAVALTGIGLAWLVDPMIAFWVCALLMVSAISATWIWFRPARRAARKHALSLDAVRVRLVDLAQGVPEFAVAGRLHAQRRAVERASEAALEALGRLDRIDRIAGAGIEMTVAFALGGAFLFGAARGLDAEVIAIAVFVALALGEVVAPLRRSLLELGRAGLAAKRIVPALSLKTAAAPQAVHAVPQGLNLQFQSVTFRHAPGREAVIERFDLSLFPGDWIALAGQSGSGKSTVLALAAALLRPDSGSIMLGDVPVFHVSSTGLYRRVGLLPQHTALFAGTIADNLRIASPEASDDRLWEILRLAVLDDVVTDKGGLGHRLGEGGAGLSGGESRRLALARLLLRDTDILLLDEPTTGLDSGTAERVLQNLKYELTGRAVLTASHRPEELSIADRIVTL